MDQLKEQAAQTARLHEEALALAQRELGVLREKLAAASAADESAKLRELLELREAELEGAKKELASVSEAIELLEVYAKKEPEWQAREKELLAKASEAGASGKDLEDLMKMLDDEKQARKELEIEALSVQEAYQKSLENQRTQTEIAELLETENKKLESQLAEALQLLEGK